MNGSSAHSRTAKRSADPSSRILKESFPFDLSGLSLEPVLRTALLRTSEAGMLMFSHLPVHEQFRVSGALRAWTEVFDTLPMTAAARGAIARPGVSLQSVRYELTMALESYIAIPLAESAWVVPILQTLLTTACDMLMFWLRRGARDMATVYERTSNDGLRVELSRPGR